MSIWSIIIAVAIFVLPSLLPGKKNAGKKTVPATSVPKDIFPVEEEDPHFMGDDDEMLFEEKEEPLVSDELGQPVFTYETVGKVEGDSKTGTDKLIDGEDTILQSDVVDSMPVTSLDEDFDLRKAIIYQTIMQRACA